MWGICASNLDTGEAICGGFLPTHSTSNSHSRWTKPMLERGAAAAF